MGIIYIFWCLAAVSIIAAAWLLVSRSVVAFAVAAFDLTGVLFCVAWLFFMMWFFREPEGIIAGLAAADWERMTFEFLLPLTVSIGVSSAAMCSFWRHTRRAHDAVQQTLTCD